MIARIVLTLMALVAVSCGSPAPTPAPTPTVTQAPASSAAAPLLVTNGTPLQVSIAVNGAVVATVPPHASDSLFATDLPAPPWAIEALSPTGRVLAVLKVGASDAIKVGASVGVVNDLACGRIEMWIGGLQGDALVTTASKPPCD